MQLELFLLKLCTQFKSKGYFGAVASVKLPYPVFQALKK